MSFYRTSDSGVAKYGALKAKIKKMAEGERKARVSSDKINQLFLWYLT